MSSKEDSAFCFYSDFNGSMATAATSTVGLANQPPAPVSKLPMVVNSTSSSSTVVTTIVPPNSTTNVSANKKHNLGYRIRRFLFPQLRSSTSSAATLVRHKSTKDMENNDSQVGARVEGRITLFLTSLSELFLTVSYFLSVLRVFPSITVYIRRSQATLTTNGRARSVSTPATKLNKRTRYRNFPLSPPRTSLVFQCLQTAISSVPSVSSNRRSPTFPSLAHVHIELVSPAYDNIFESRFSSLESTLPVQSVPRCYIQMTSKRYFKMTIL